MNSLEELNGYAQDLELPYTDLRSPTVTFDTSATVNQTQTVDEGFTFLSTVGIEITEIINPAVSSPTYTIDVKNIPGTTVTWGTIPSGLTLTNPQPGVYTISGLTTIEQWDAIKQGTITLPTNYYGLWTYTSTIRYYSAIEGNKIMGWTTAVTVNDVQFLTSPLSFVYPVNAVTAVETPPQIANLDTSYPGATWTVVGTPSSTSSIDTWTTTGTGGTFSVNGTTKVFTISGTRAQVNSRLAGLTIDSNANGVDMIITYVCSNSLNSTTDTKTQLFSSVGLLYLGAVSEPSIYFNEDASSAAVGGAPTITDSFYDGSGLYTYTVTPSNTSAITSLSTTGTGGTSSFNNSTKVLTITGTRSQINNRLPTLTMVTAVDWGTDFNLSYTVRTPRYDTATKLQLALCGTNDTEVSNMNISRTYIANNPKLIFAANTPEIIDLDPSESTYTISFVVSSSFGSFSFSDSGTTTSSITFTGTRAQCNAKFPTLRFWPVAGVSSNGTFVYTQLKNGTQQVNQTVSLLGSAGSYSGSRTLTFTAGSTFTPTISDVKYAKFELFLLGGGGEGSAYGGGGGGEIVTVQDLTFTNQTYNISIGAGGDGPALGIARAGYDGGTTSAFGYTAAGGKGGSSSQYTTCRWGGNGGGDIATRYAGRGGYGGITANNEEFGGGGGAGATGYTGFATQDGGQGNSSTGAGGLGGSSNGYLWDGFRRNTGIYGNGGNGGSVTIYTAPRANAGAGSWIGGGAEYATDGYGGGGGGGVWTKKPGYGHGGSGRVMIRIYSA